MQVILLLIGLFGVGTALVYLAVTVVLGMIAAVFWQLSC